VDVDRDLQSGTATNLKRYARHLPGSSGWGKPNHPQWILDTVEFKTVWHPVGW
jgi:hypothetical protein